MLKTTFFAEHYVCAIHPEELRVSAKDVTRGDAIFVSGKLMDPEFIRQLTGHHVPFTHAVARNYERGERGRGSKKTLLLQPGPGRIVLGVLLLKLTETDKTTLDKFEQVPDVRRKVPIRVTIGAFERTATTFLLNE